jgi:hypothetical protein
MDPVLARRLAQQREKASQNEIETDGGAAATPALVGRGHRTASQAKRSIDSGPARFTAPPPHETVCEASGREEAEGPTRESDTTDTPAADDPGGPPPPPQVIDADGDSEEEQDAFAAEQSMPSFAPPPPPPVINFRESHFGEPDDPWEQEQDEDVDDDDDDDDNNPPGDSVEGSTDATTADAVARRPSHRRSSASIPSRLATADDPAPPPDPPPPDDDAPPLAWRPPPPSADADVVPVDDDGAEGAGAQTPTVPVVGTVARGWKPPPPPGDPPPGTHILAPPTASTKGLRVFPACDTAATPFFGAFAAGSAGLGSSSGRSVKAPPDFGMPLPPSSPHGWKPPPPPGAPPPSRTGSRPRAVSGNATTIAGAAGGGLGLPRISTSGGARGLPPMPPDDSDVSSDADEGDDAAAAEGSRTAALLKGAPGAAAAPHAHAGYLSKMGGQRGLSRVWHERYCVLRDGVLVYYLTHNDAAVEGEAAAKSKQPFPLRGATIIAPARRNGLALGKHAALSFELKPPPGAAALKPLVFAAETPRVLQQWLVALHAAATAAEPSAQAGSAGIVSDAAA